MLSDFFDKGDLSEALRYLGGEKHDVYAIQLLAPQEVDPAKGNVLGDLRLRDIEDGDVAEVSVSPALLKRYKANLQAYCQYVPRTVPEARRRLHDQRDGCAVRYAGVEVLTSTGAIRVKLE